MPDLVLTLPQIRRLCGLPEDVCARAVETLVACGVLRKADNGRVISGTSRRFNAG